MVVFRYPLNPSQDYIKRVVGVPGDEVAYQDKKLTVNGRPCAADPDGTYSYLEGMRFETTDRAARRPPTPGRDRQEYTIVADPTMPPVHPRAVRRVPGPRELRLQ